MTQFRMCRPLLAVVLISILAFVANGSADEPPLSFPRITPLAPPAAAKSFEVLNGFKMDLLAAEPLVSSPVTLEYDEHGQGWVLEMRDYPFTDKNTDKPFVDKSGDLPLGQIRVLRDTDGDGVFDASQLFAQDISWPTGLAFWKGGVFVTATPDIWYFKDTDGDGVADVREKVFTGFRKFNIQAVINNLKWGLDHQIYGAGGTNGGSIKSLRHPALPALPFAANDFRIDPTTTRFEAISGGARFGLTFDDWGNRFLCNIRNPVIHVLLPAHYLARNPAVPFQKATVDAADAGDTLPVYRSSPPEAWRTLRAQRWSGNVEGLSYPRSELVPDGYFTSACGVTIYRGTAYPPDYYGQAFLADVASNLIHREAMTAAGVTFKARRIDEKSEFVRSQDVWFRPVNFVNAPDGTLHVVDMYRETIEHPWSIPDDIKAALDLESGRNLGRLWRLTPPNFKPAKFQSLATATTAELVAQLENRNAWHRETAHRLLFERQDQSALEPLRKLLQTSPDPLARLHALWSLLGLRELTDEDVLVGLADPVGGVREHAVRLAEGRLGLQPKFLQRVLELADDPEPRVRFQVAFSLGGVEAEGVGEALVRIAKQDAGDEYIRSAVLSSSARRGAKLLEALVKDSSFAARPEVRPFLRLLAQSVGAGKSNDDLQTVGSLLLAVPTTPATRPWKSEVVSGLGDGLKRTGRTLAAVYATINPQVNALTADLLQDAMQVVVNRDEEVAERIQAAQMLGHGQYASVHEPLFLCLDPRQPPALQQAAIKTLAIFPELEVAKKLLAGWNGFSPPVRTEVVEVLLAKPDRIPLLLEAVQQGQIGVGQITPVRRGLLMKHADLAIRERAKVLFARESPGPRGEIIKDYQQKLAALQGDAQRGARIFERECATCHRIGDKGQEVGPNLETIRHHAPLQVLTNLLDPSREVSPAYVEYIVTTLEGRVATGMMASETATSVTLRRANNVQETILRANIDEIVGSGKSLMPEGLEKKVTPQEVADLLAYVLGRKPGTAAVTPQSPAAGRVEQGKP